MNTTELLELFRDEVGDQESPYLWSDEFVYARIGDAQKQFCRKTNGIADARTAAVTKLRVVPGTEWIDLDESILKIRTITRADTGAPVRALNTEHLEDEGVRFDGTAGTLRAVVQGFEEHAVRCWPVPPTGTQFTAATTAIAALGAIVLELDVTNLYKGMTVTAAGIPEFTTITEVGTASVTLSAATTAEIASATTITFDLTLNLSVFRLPIVPITDAGDQELEIDSQHHEHLLMWVKHRAYGKQDAETYDKKKSADCKADFFSYCEAAKAEQNRARRVGTPVAYGGY